MDEFLEVILLGCFISSNKSIPATIDALIRPHCIMVAAIAGLQCLFAVFYKNSIVLRHHRLHHICTYYD